MGTAASAAGTAAPPVAARAVALRPADLDDLALLTDLPQLGPLRSGASVGGAEGALLPLRLRVAGPPVLPGSLELLDPEGTPVARVDVVAAPADGEEQALTGDVELLRQPGRQPFQRLRRPPLPGGPVRLAAVVDRPPSSAEVAGVRNAAVERGTSVLWVVLVGHGSSRVVGVEALVRAVVAVAADGEEVVAVPVAAHPRLPPSRQAALQVAVGAAYAGGDGRDRVCLLTAEAGSAPSRAAAQLVPVARDHGLDRVLEALDAGEEPPPLVDPAVLAVLAQERRGPGEVGGVVLLTGLSGSGKSTVARVLRDLLVEAGRRVTLLDGDEVRALLSSGLGFSREDRDLNVRRIGFVAAEVARHGGIAVAAPIAPYAMSRADVRRRAEEVGDFVLVHVATPLHECERRDRKGLYAAARDGRLASFTGISDPYETPDDADLALDTTGGSPEGCAAAVLDLLAERGWLGRRRS